ncbi:hypothetical protein HPB47_027980 [Ixodes persulcatus]|uniref:Uncharacterized protein n=2 Tax=Ixodes TaxID=6944 RepID=A0A0K8RI27_IXORI|nr:hypothetical protein HPB47_027980 [Ixodes persulcatus]
MAFMMPVVKNDYMIYQQNGNSSKSRRSSSCSMHSRASRGPASGQTSLSCSPGSDVEERLRAVESERGTRRTSRCSDVVEAPRSASQSSLYKKFHTRVVDKLRRTLRSKDDSVVGSEDQATVQKAAALAASRS